MDQTDQRKDVFAQRAKLTKSCAWSKGRGICNSIGGMWYLRSNGTFRSAASFNKSAWKEAINAVLKKRKKNVFLLFCLLQHFFNFQDLCNCCFLQRWMGIRSKLLMQSVQLNMCWPDLKSHRHNELESDLTYPGWWILKGCSCNS